MHSIDFSLAVLEMFAGGSNWVDINLWTKNLVPGPSEADLLGSPFSGFAERWTLIFADLSEQGLELLVAEAAAGDTDHNAIIREAGCVNRVWAGWLWVRFGLDALVSHGGLVLGLGYRRLGGCVLICECVFCDGVGVHGY